ncbi:MAG: murein biosynthesis integral membrane protein MurJ [Sinobacteraceae bacterium]|nr:murein biosynthesis integral membrane protein MurJ [Nevskiaceae bacterium]
MSDPGRTPNTTAPARSGGFASLLIGAGILLSRVAGLIRERVIASCFGAGLHADVFSAGLRLPNAIQNLLGEGTLSASFIPVYAELLGQGRSREAGRVAGAMFALLLAVAGAIALAGIALAPLLVSVFTPGFEGHRRELMITVTRIFFPMTGVLVLSAWALGILNSHRQFFVPYFAPVLWNAAIIAALLGFRNADLDRLLTAAATGALLGGLVQFAFQLPWVLRLDREIRLNLGRREPAFLEAVRNAGPAILGRGVVQISAYADLILASLLAVGAVSRLRYAQTLYVLPISLFAMSIAAAELPELARERGGLSDALRTRLRTAGRRVAFFIVPSLAAFVLLGPVLVAGLYQTGQFQSADVTLVWLTLAAYSLGMMASTSTRLYQSACYALRDTRTPARIAALRVLMSAAAGTMLMLQFEPIQLGSWLLPAGLWSGMRIEGLPLGPVGLALGAAVGAWLEWTLLRRHLAARLGHVGVGLPILARMFIAALFAAGIGALLAWLIASLHPLPKAALVASGFGVGYLAAAQLLGLDEASSFAAALLRRLRRR